MRSLFNLRGSSGDLRKSQWISILARSALTRKDTWSSKLVMEVPVPSQTQTSLIHLLGTILTLLTGLMTLAMAGFKLRSSPCPAVLRKYSSTLAYLTIETPIYFNILRLKPPNKARVIGTTPKFANGIYAPTSLYDLMEEVYEQPKRAKEGDNYKVDDIGWYEDIWPLLQRPPLLSWVNEQANRGHGKCIDDF